MEIPRRRFLEEITFGAAIAAVLGRTLWARPPAGPLGASEKSEKAAPPIRIGGCDWSLGKEGNTESFALAKSAGLDGVEVSCGKGKERLPISDRERQKSFLDAAKAAGLPIPSTCLEVLHRDGLKSHADAPKWVAEAIEATKALGARTILLPFFGKQQIRERAEQKAVAERLKALAPAAEKAGVVLGLENTISARDNAWILDQVASPAVKVYYDVGNSTGGGFDINEEIVFLGKDRIAQLHLKDGGALLGKGKIDYPRLAESILKSGFQGWAMLETTIVGSAKESFAANATYVRGLLDSKSRA